MQTNKARAKTGAFEDHKTMTGKISGRVDKGRKETPGAGEQRRVPK